MASCLKTMRKTKKGSYETPLMRNGGILLEELIASCDGKCNPIRSYTAKELEKATSNYDSNLIVLKESAYKLFKGFFENCSVTVKKYDDRKDSVEKAITDIVIGSQMSAHNHVLKLIGCCLETESPILVHEFVGNVTLDDCIFAGKRNQLQPLPWKCRLKVATNIANAVAYLHTALPKIVINRDIKPQLIIMDGNNVPKLFDFGLCVSIPEGESHVEADNVVGTLGSLAPECFRTRVIDEKIDVYSFGVTLAMLLTGRKGIDFYKVLFEDETSLMDHEEKRIKQNKFKEMVDPVIVAEESWPGKDQQLEAFAALALRCVRRKPEFRPTMTEVGKELRQMYQSATSTC